MTISKNSIHIAILSAMEEEVGEFVIKFKLNNKHKYGDLNIYGGEWKNSSGIKVFLSLAWSGWGKISAARASTRLISANKDDFGKVNLILFSGVAGAAKANLKQWDVVIGNSLLQHDMDARPLFDKFVIPSLGKSTLSPKNFLLEDVFSHLQRSIIKGNLSNFGSINSGLIATGDKFISNKYQLKDLIEEIPDLYALEMEGAALAQVAEQEEIDWLVIRVISDNADESAADNFADFLKKYKKFSSQLIEELLDILCLALNKF